MPSMFENLSYDLVELIYDEIRNQKINYYAGEEEQKKEDIYNFVVCVSEYYEEITEEYFKKTYYKRIGELNEHINEKIKDIKKFVNGKDEDKKDYDFLKWDVDSKIGHEEEKDDIFRKEIRPFIKKALPSYKDKSKKEIEKILNKIYYEKGIIKKRKKFYYDMNNFFYVDCKIRDIFGEDRAKYMMDRDPEPEKKTKINNESDSDSEDSD